MNDFDNFDDDSSGTVFRDVILLALAGFVTVVMLLLPHINPRAVNQEASKSPGNVIVEIRWPDKVDIDVDLWVEAPGDKPVGFSNRAGAIFNLLRDDVGRTGDITGLNYEFSYSRGIPPGDYTVNTHLYRNQENTYPVPVTVIVSVKDSSQSSAKQLLVKEVELKFRGEEVTAFRFELNEAGKLVNGSVHDMPRKLANVKQT